MTVTRSNLTLESWVAEQSSKRSTFLLSEAARSEALKELENGHYPTRKDEEWRYTPIKRLLDKQLFSETSETSIPTMIEQGKLAVPEACHLIFIDGVFSPEYSDSISDFRGLELFILNANDETTTSEVEELIQSAEWSDENIFKSLTLSLAQTGLFLKLAKNSSSDRPLHFLYISTGTRSDSIGTPVTFIKAGENSSISLVEQFTSSGQTSAMTIPATFMSVAQGASLKHYKVGLESADIEHISNTHLSLADGASASLHQYLLGSGMTRTNTEVKLAGPGAEIELRGLYLGENTQHLDIRTYIDHAEPHGKSDQHFRGILDDQSRGVFNGLVLVRPDAQHTDAQQSNKNLLLSADARVDTKPQLEIFADDVKCAHGATVGQLDRDALFYLQSRAISKSDAKLMLTRAFTAEVTDDIALESLRDFLETALDSRLNKLHIDHA